MTYQNPESKSMAMLSETQKNVDMSSFILFYDEDLEKQLELILIKVAERYLIYDVDGNFVDEVLFEEGQ